MLPYTLITGSKNISSWSLRGYGIDQPPAIVAYVHRVQSLAAVQDWLNAARKEEESAL